MEENQNSNEEKIKGDEPSTEANKESPEVENKIEQEVIEKSPEEKILELEDKLARTFAEMENQRRRFEKEKEDAFEYGGYSFAKEALSLSSLSRTCFDLSKLSIKFNASLAKL